MILMKNTIRQDYITDYCKIINRMDYRVVKNAKRSNTIMNISKTYFLIVLLFSLSLTISAQQYNISNYHGQTISTCSGTFYDSGGPASNHGTAESYTVTFCPSTPNTYVQLIFTQWQVGAGASMQVFDGPNTTFNSFGTFTQTGFNPMNMDVAASPLNTSGCLTIQWTSGSAVAAGWAAEVVCVIPCQTILANLFSSNPPVDSEGFIDVCPGQNIILNGGGLFPQNNLVYSQTNATSTFVWNYGNGVIDTASSTVSINFPDVGGYNINLTVIDSMGCESSNVLDLRVRLSTQPTFIGTMPEEPIICDGEEVVLIGNPQPTPFEVTAELGLAGTTFLPDGSGASYSTSLLFDAFAPGQTLTDVDDFLSICATMEHSYLGDLTIWLECPNGNTVNLIVYPNGCGGTYLGEPIDVDAILDPGVGYEYCWSPNPDYGSFSAECGGFATMPAGIYDAVSPWSNFLGCPLNGTWTIGITDNLLSDNGYIFEWGINFDPEILPSNFNYEPELIDFNWSNLGGVLIEDQDTNAIIAPSAGNYNYTFTVVDDFGCSYDTVVDLTVLPSYIVNFPADTILCSDAILPLDATNNGGNAGAIYEWYWDQQTSMLTSNGNYTVTKPGTYWVEIPNIVSDCGFTDTIVVVYNELELDLGNNISGVCSSNQVTLDATTPVAGYVGGVAYMWNTGAVSPTISPWSSGTYSVSVTRGNCTEIDTITVAYDQVLNLNLPAVQYLCQGDLLTISPGIIGQTYSWSTGSSASSIEISNPGVYSLTISNACGSSIDATEIIAYTIPVVEIGPDLVTCFGTGQVINAAYTGVGPQPDYLWSTGETAPVISAGQQGYYSVTLTNDCGSNTDELYLEVEHPLNLNIGNDTTICAGESLELGINEFGNYVYWSTGETTDTILVNSADTYYVEVENSCGSYYTSIDVAISNLVANIGNDTTICPGSSFLLSPIIPGASHYFWSDGSTSSTLMINEAGSYQLTVSNIHNCSAEAGILIDEFNLALNLGNDTTICLGDVLELTSNFPDYPNLWSNGENTPSIFVSEQGLYGVTIYHLCGELSDEINVNFVIGPTVALGEDTIYIPMGTTTILDAGNAGATFSWSTGEQTQSIEVGEGDYSVTVSLNGCYRTDEIVVIYLANVNPIDDLPLIKVYPNPANAFFNIQTREGSVDRFELYNALGQNIRLVDMKQSNYRMETQNLPDGIYLLRFYLRDGGTETRQLVIHRK